MRRAATLCDGWLPSNSKPIYPLDTTERFTDAVSRLRRLLEAQGRDPHDFVIRFGGASWDGDVSKKDQVADEIHGWAKLGVTHQNFGGGSSVAERLELMESFATEVFPLVHD